MVRLAARFAALSLLFLALPLHAQTPSVARAAMDRGIAELRAGRPAAAYDLLLPLEMSEAGDPTFDYYFGIAALDSGRPVEAVVALQRATMVQPGFLQARAELGRAYMASGDMAAATRELNDVKAAGVPPEVAATIERYLAGIQGPPPSAPGQRERTRFEGFVTASAGYDSNVNGGPAASQIAIPAFAALGLATLNPTARESADWFGSVGGGVGVRHALTDTVALLGSLGANLSGNRERSDYDSGAVDGSVGIAFTGARHQIQLALQGQEYWLDDQRYRRALGGIAQASYAVTAQDIASVFVQYTDQRYHQDPSRNADRIVGGLAWAHSFGTDARVPSLYASVYGGREIEQDKRFPTVGNGFGGARVGGELPVYESWRLYANASYEERYYGGEEALFFIGRRDRQTDLGAGVIYDFAPGWSATFDGRFTDNASNIVIADFDRLRLTLTVRYQF